MKITALGQIYGGQDGAIWNGILFKFDGSGVCKVYDVNGFKEIASLKLDTVLIPHSNSVTFGAEYFEEGDEFPLLYTNIYNNYDGQPESYKGTCLAFRITRSGNEFSFTLKQVIKLGFCEDSTVWCSKEGDIRPFGNFIVDRDNGKYYAFNMMDGIKKSRYLVFDMPKICDGVLDEGTGIRTVVLNKEDILKQFDLDYHNCLQGATVYKGKIYSVEGGTKSISSPAALRIIDPASGKQEFFALFRDYIEDREPEYIDFYKDVCYYGDNYGYLYTIEF
jgi:hypothetical protein